MCASTVIKAALPAECKVFQIDLPLKSCAVTMRQRLPLGKTICHLAPQSDIGILWVLCARNRSASAPQRSWFPIIQHAYFTPDSVSNHRAKRRAVRVSVPAVQANPHLWCLQGFKQDVQYLHHSGQGFAFSTNRLEVLLFGNCHCRCEDLRGNEGISVSDRP